MVEFIIMVAVLGVVGMFGVLGVATYKADPVGWKATMKRISKFTRANLEAGKPPKAVETKNVRQKLEQDWDNRFHGKPTAIAPVAQVKPALPVHKVVESWITRPNNIGNKYHWKCACGTTGGTFDKGLARGESREHIRDATAADRAKASGSKLQW